MFVETALRGEGLGLVIATQIILSSGILKLCIDVVKTDASHVTSEEAAQLERIAKERMSSVESEHT